MRQINKSKFYLSSANRTSGTTGNFTINAPIPLKFQPSLFYKVYPLQIVMRNDASWTTAADTITVAINGNPGYTWTLPIGSPSVDDIANAFNNFFGGILSNIECSYVPWTSGFLFQCGNAPMPFTLTFSASAAPKLGFVAGGSYSGRPGSPVFSPNAAIVNPILAYDIVTSLPRHNYAYASGKFGESGITTRMPITVPYMATQVYTDVNGANAMFESYRDHIDSIAISIQTDQGKPVLPISDWLLTLCIETWVDDDEQHLSTLKQVATSAHDIAMNGKLDLMRKDLKQPPPAQKNRPVDDNQWVDLDAAPALPPGGGP